MATFGNTVQGASQAVFANNSANATRFTAPADIGAVSKLSAYFPAIDTGSNMEGAIWLQSTLALIAVSTPTNVTAGGGLFDFTFSSPPTLTPNTDYYLGTIIQNGGSLRPRMFYDSTASANYGVDNQLNNYASPTNLSADGTTTKNYSVFATYTPTVQNGFNIALV